MCEAIFSLPTSQSQKLNISEKGISEMSYVVSESLDSRGREAAERGKS